MGSRIDCPFFKLNDVFKNAPDYSSTRSHSDRANRRQTWRTFPKGTRPSQRASPLSPSSSPPRANSSLPASKRNHLRSPHPTRRRTAPPSIHAGKILVERLTANALGKLQELIARQVADRCSQNWLPALGAASSTQATYGVTEVLSPAPRDSSNGWSIISSCSSVSGGRTIHRAANDDLVIARVGDCTVRIRPLVSPSAFDWISSSTRSPDSSSARNRYPRRFVHFGLDCGIVICCTVSFVLLVPSLVLISLVFLII